MNDTILITLLLDYDLVYLLVHFHFARNKQNPEREKNGNLRQSNIQVIQESSYQTTIVTLANLQIG